MRRRRLKRGSQEFCIGRSFEAKNVCTRASLSYPGGSIRDGRHGPGRGPNVERPCDEFHTLLGYLLLDLLKAWMPSDAIKSVFSALGFIAVCNRWANSGTVIQLASPWLNLRFTSNLESQCPLSSDHLRMPKSVLGTTPKALATPGRSPPCPPPDVRATPLLDSKTPYF